MVVPDNGICKPYAMLCDLLCNMIRHAASGKVYVLYGICTEKSDRCLSLSVGHTLSLSGVYGQ